jgi:hypothetical protein
VLWSDAVIRAGNVPVAQGFAAKVYLFGTESPAPVTAPGSFTVYAFDDGSGHGPGAAHVKPIKTWEFQESQLRPLVKKDAVGWSYPLWLPLSPPADSERRHSLILCFNAADGRRTLSQTTLVTLRPVCNQIAVSASASADRTAELVVSAGVNPPHRYSSLEDLP